MNKLILCTILNFSALGVLFGQYRPKYPNIPIVDVHFHPRGVSDVSNLNKVSETIKQKYGSNLAFRIGLIFRMKFWKRYTTGMYNVLKLYPGLKTAMGL